MEVLTSGTSLPSFDSSELDDVDLERLIQERRDRETRSARVTALRAELAQTEGRIARAQGAADAPYSLDAGHPLNACAPGEVPWARPLTTGRDALPTFTAQREDILAELERLGERVE